MKPISSAVLKEILLALKNSIINTIDNKLSIITSGIFKPSESVPTNNNVKFFPIMEFMKNLLVVIEQ